MTKIHVIPHTHWDREWYFTQQDSDVLAAYNFTKVIETLEKQADYSCYHLDGQSAIVEDYLKILPHMRERMAKLVRDKRLFIGPWYTQTDTFNVAGESIIRNLKYGMHIAEEMGHCMMVGYLPDTFGHNAQMPTLFQGFGIDNIVFWRGIDYDSQVERSNFFWQSPGGDRITAYNLVYGYGAAKNITASPSHLDNKIFPMVEKIKALSGLDEVLIPSGGDQVNIDPELPETLRKATQRSPQEDLYCISSMENYVDYLHRSSDGFETYQGEFKTPRYTRIHKTIGSVRYDIKKLNFEIEQFLLKKLELLSAIAKAHDIEVHTELLDIAWKKIIECHAHDSIGGCNSDATNADIVHRLKQAEQICHGLYNLIIKNIAAQVCDEDELMIFNNRLTPFNGIVDAVVFSQHEAVEILHQGTVLPSELVKREKLDGGKVIESTKDGEKEVDVPAYYRFTLKVRVTELPAVGYCTYQVIKADTKQEQPKSISAVIDNDFLSLRLENGCLAVTEKCTGRVIDKLIHFENQADDGDSYDFSPLAGDAALYSDAFELLETQKGELCQQMKLRCTMSVPADLEERRLGQSSRCLSFIVTLTLTVEQQNLLVDISTCNQVKDHRVRVVINSDICTDKSISTQPFALMEHAVAPNIEGWQTDYRECPIDIETTEGIVALAQSGRALILNGRGLKEFQILKSADTDQIAFTLFKSTGVLGKDDLLWRPGRASGINNTVVHTPDAQLQQSMNFSFSLALTTQASHQVIREIETEYLNQPFCYQKQSLNSFENRLERFQVSFDKKTMAKSFSLFSLSQALQLSSISHSFYHKDVLLLRLYNPTNKAIQLDLNQFNHFAEVSIVNYREQTIENADAQVTPNNTVDLRLLIKGQCHV
ncbi:glycoside hydrolase family 38 C-terminal domain-containing protein [Psychromonas ossibalaenae]|uniref:glycoside hydrolase family 38 N-terminal domain-containing protein n=1 Tax=Psychromonas ossibalaenae TaxID=444922 RepID=UPI00035E2E2F|nr:glycoside hydrolase family 38 C-terminal domain-containing protein [Psychromonas ossibalaenae]